MIYCIYMYIMKFYSVLAIVNKSSVLVNTLEMYLSKLKLFSVGSICSIAASADGLLFCSVASDKSLKVFDVINFGK